MVHDMVVHGSADRARVHGHVPRGGGCHDGQPEVATGSGTRWVTILQTVLVWTGHGPRGRGCRDRQPEKFVSGSGERG